MIKEECECVCISKYNFQKVMAIIQLCCAFSLMMWHITRPFMGEYYLLRSRMILYEYVMGNSEMKNGTAIPNLKKLFETLTAYEKKWLNDDYQQLKSYANRKIFTKIGDSLKYFLIDMPPFELAWIFFSIVIAVLILLKQEGIKQAVWIIPFIALIYSIDNQMNGRGDPISPDLQLFPKEEIVVNQFLKEPLARNLFEQKEQLKKGWENYLIEKWSTKASNRKSQIEEGVFNFTLARLKLLREQGFPSWLYPQPIKQSLFTLSFYIIWNGMFGWLVSRHI